MKLIGPMERRVMHHENGVQCEPGSFLLTCSDIANTFGFSYCLSFLCMCCLSWSRVKCSMCRGKIVKSADVMIASIYSGSSFVRYYPKVVGPDICSACLAFHKEAISTFPFDLCNPVIHLGYAFFPSVLQMKQWIA